MKNYRTIAVENNIHRITKGRRKLRQRYAGLAMASLIRANHWTSIDGLVDEAFKIADKMTDRALVDDIEDTVEYYMKLLEK